MLPVAAIVAFAGRQLGRIASLAFSWATTTLFGRVPQRKRTLVTGMAIASLLWPVMVAGIVQPSVATFLLAFVTLPSFVDPWVRPVMLAFALALPLAVGGLGAWLHEPRPRGRALAAAVLRGYPTALGLFLVLLWMVVLAPLIKLQALLRRWESAHVAIAVKPGGYEHVVRDLAAALGRAGLTVRTQRAGWVYELPGQILAALGGSRVRALVPPRLLVLRAHQLDVVVHPMDLSLRGSKSALARARAAVARELTFTEAHQTWDPAAQEEEDALARAAGGEGDLDEIGRRIERIELDFEQWEILYRLFLQVRLRRSSREADALVSEEEVVAS